MNLKANSYRLRQDVLDIIYRAKTGHIGGDFSVTDILNVLYNQVMDITPENFRRNDRDHFILSKGHAVEALYAVLCQKGFFPREDLLTVSQYGSKYIGHPYNKVNGIEMNSGSLGHGLSVAVGMAIAGKMDKSSHRVYAGMGDGGLAEGSVWEGAMAGGHYKLDNLCAVIDRNHLQISGTTEYVMNQKVQEERWAAFGWNVISVNGNDVDALQQAFADAAAFKGKPTVIVAHTTKGCGVSFMENQAGWHHRVPTAEEYEKGMAELKAKEAAANE